MYEKERKGERDEREKRNLSCHFHYHKYTRTSTLSFNSPSIYIYIISYCFVRFISLFASFGHNFKYYSQAPIFLSCPICDSHKLYPNPLTFLRLRLRNLLRHTRHTLTQIRDTQDEISVLRTTNRSSSIFYVVN